MFTIFSLFFHTYFPRSCGQRAKIEVTHCHILIRAALTVIEAAATIKPVTIRGCILRIYQSRVPVLKKATMAMCWTWWSIGYIVHFRGVECFKCSFRRQNWAEFLVFWSMFWHIHRRKTNTAATVHNSSISAQCLKTKSVQTNMYDTITTFKRPQSQFILPSRTWRLHIFQKRLGRFRTFELFSFSLSSLSMNLLDHVQQTYKFLCVLKQSAVVH